MALLASVATWKGLHTTFQRPDGEGEERSTASGRLQAAAPVTIAAAVAAAPVTKKLGYKAYFLLKAL